MAIERVKRKLTTIISSDLMDCIRLMGEDAVATVQTLTAYWGGIRKNYTIHLNSFTICD